jgi:MinD superfamily P-loop ATPase
MPLHTITSYIARISNEDCVGCGTCEQKCPVEAIDLVDDTAVLDETKCIGCGVCSHHCPEQAINLERVGPRNVFIPPKKYSVK